MSDIRKFSTEDLQQEIERRMRERHNPPPGFSLIFTEYDKDLLASPNWSGEWVGPRIEGDSWEVSSQWNNTEGITFDVNRCSPTLWPLSEAENLANAIHALKAQIEAGAL